MLAEEAARQRFALRQRREQRRSLPPVQRLRRDRHHTRAVGVAPLQPRHRRSLRKQHGAVVRRCESRSVPLVPQLRRQHRSRVGDGRDGRHVAVRQNVLHPLGVRYVVRGPCLLEAAAGAAAAAAAIPEARELHGGQQRALAQLLLDGRVEGGVRAGAQHHLHRGEGQRKGVRKDEVQQVLLRERRVHEKADDVHVLREVAAHLAEERRALRLHKVAQRRVLCVDHRVVAEDLLHPFVHLADAVGRDAEAGGDGQVRLVLSVAVAVGDDAAPEERRLVDEAFGTRHLHVDADLRLGVQIVKRLGFEPLCDAELEGNHILPRRHKIFVRHAGVGVVQHQVRLPPHHALLTAARPLLLGGQRVDVRRDIRVHDGLQADLHVVLRDVTRVRRDRAVFARVLLPHREVPLQLAAVAVGVAEAGLALPRLRGDEDVARLPRRQPVVVAVKPPQRRTHGELVLVVRLEERLDAHALLVVSCVKRRLEAPKQQRHVQLDQRLRATLLDANVDDPQVRRRTLDEHRRTRVVFDVVARRRDRRRGLRAETAVADDRCRARVRAPHTLGGRRQAVVARRMFAAGCADAAATLPNWCRGRSGGGTRQGRRHRCQVCLVRRRQTSVRGGSCGCCGLLTELRRFQDADDAEPHSERQHHDDGAAGRAAPSPSAPHHCSIASSVCGWVCGGDPMKYRYCSF
eukprot:Rhum_TRINITY_DN4786_c0_g1::Rhum_TRINITY_DN4786_c0_g1_i1::g.15694::m.15694